MIPEGTYLARATEAKLGKTSKGGEQIAVSFQISEGGHRITWFGYFTDKTWERTIESLRHCGWVGDDLSNLQGIDSNEVELVIAHETYEGNTSARVQWVNAPGGGMALKAPMEENEAKSFAARMRGNIIALAKNGPKPKPPKSRAGAQSPNPPPHTDADEPGTDSDIPF